MAVELTKEYVIKKLIKLIQAAVFFYIIYCGFIYARVFTAAKKVPSFDRSEILRIIIFGSSTRPDGNTVSARFSIIDSGGGETAVIERSWRGNYLSADFFEEKISGKSFFFPYEIYAKERIYESPRFTKARVKLVRYYDENQECTLLGFQSAKKERENLYILSSFANGKFKVPRIGKVKKITVDLSSCETERYYSVSQDSDGKEKRLTVKAL